MSAIVLQGELATTSAELARASGEAEKLRGQLTASVAETQQLRSNLAKLSEETAVVERKLAAEVHTPSMYRRILRLRYVALLSLASTVLLLAGAVIWQTAALPVHLYS